MIAPITSRDSIITTLLNKMHVPFHLLAVALLQVSPSAALALATEQEAQPKERRLRRKRKALDVTPFFMNTDYGNSPSEDSQEELEPRKLGADRGDGENAPDESRLRSHRKPKNLLDVTPFMLQAHGQKESVLNMDDDNLARVLQKVMSMDPTPAPSTDESPTPAPSANETPTRAPTPSDGSCNPTSGSCIDNFQELQDAANAADVGDVIAMCGGGITTETELVIEQARITLCCEDDASEECVFMSSGVNRNLVALGPAFTLRGIDFFDGQAPPTEDDAAPVASNAGGGNVIIQGDGNHTIDGCGFYNGLVDDATRYGGNLFVKTPGSVDIKNSLFINGSAFLGGGAAICNAVNFSCTDSEFRDNSGSAVFSGNLDEDLRDPGQTILYDSSVFTGNSGDFGGGFLASGIGSVPTLSLFDCSFDENVSERDGAAGAVFADSDGMNLFIMDNEGQDNEVEDGFCDAFYVVLNSGEECYAVESEVFIEAGEGEV